MELPSCKLGPELRVLLRAGKFSANENAVMLAFNLMTFVPHELEEYVVCSKDCPVGVELDDSHRFLDRVDLGCVICSAEFLLRDIRGDFNDLLSLAVGA